MDTNTDQHSPLDDTDAPINAMRESDTAALSLFSFRRKGVQIVLTIMLSTALSVLSILLIFYGFSRVEETVVGDLERLTTSHDVPTGAADQSVREMAK